MRKFIALFLTLILLTSLFACGKNGQTQPSSSSVTVSRPLNPTEALVHQAHYLAKQLATAAGSNYMEAAGANEEILSLANAFKPAAVQLPSKALVTRVNNPYFLEKSTAIISNSSNNSLMACVGMLTFSTQFPALEALEMPIAVFLQYGDNCSIMVYFQPLEGTWVSAKVIPVPTAAKDRILNQYFKNNKIYSTAQFADNADQFATLSFAAEHTGNTVNAEYYEDLAKAVFVNAKQLDGQDFEKHTANDQVISYAIAFSKALTSDILSARVYDISGHIDAQTADLLGQDANAQALQDWVRMRVATAVPSSLCNVYGANVVSANALLSNVLKVNTPGATASESEDAVLVILELTGNMSVVVVLCPNEYNTYYYSFSCLPVPLDQAHTAVTSIGAVPMK